MRNILAETLLISGAQASYREDHGKLRARSVIGTAGEAIARTGLDALNREFMHSPLRGRPDAKLDGIE